MHTSRKLGFIIMLLSVVLATPAFSEESAYPVAPGDVGKVSCLSDSSLTYEIYLPSGYTPEKKTLPILITFSPGGGGMVNAFKVSAEKMQFIVVGNIESKNNRDDNLIYGSIFAMTRDLMERVSFDPTAVFAAGFSGGGEKSYDFTRRFQYLVSGLMPGGGWLGGKKFQTTWYEYVPGLLDVRQTGKSDKNASAWLDSDATHLKKYGVKIYDMAYEGGHAVPPAETLEGGIQWLLDNRMKEKPEAVDKANADYEGWKKALASRGPGSVLSDCFKTCQKNPRSSQAFLAQRMIFEILKDPENLAKRSPGQLGSGQASASFWGHIAEGAILSGDQKTAESAILCLVKVGKLDGAWYAHLIRAMCYGPDGRVTDAAMAENLLKLLGKSKVSPESAVFADIMQVEALSLTGKWEQAKKAFAKLKAPSEDQKEAYQWAKEHIENQKPTLLKK